MDDRKYKIMSESTMGWILIDNEAQNLTKSECNKWIDDLLRRGDNPNHFKVVAQNDPRYPSDEV